MNKIIAIYEVKNTRKKRANYCSYGGGELIRFNSDALANAIIVQACDDYRQAKRELRRLFVKKQRAQTRAQADEIDARIRSVRFEIRRLEKFIEESDLVALASNDFGKDILRRLKRAKGFMRYLLPSNNAIRDLHERVSMD